MAIETSKPDYVSVTVECTHCNTKQIVRVSARAGFVGKGTQTIKCIECQKEFEAVLPDKIMSGPFRP
jgi:DNA-directed RNA polymerase subunit RPC12/RpoP